MDRHPVPLAPPEPDLDTVRRRLAEVVKDGAAAIGVGDVRTIRTAGDLDRLLESLSNGRTARGERGAA